jgi:DNA-binding NarL/FixJ family response regulator
VAIRILVVDDHEEVRQGFQMLLALDSEMDVVGEASNGADALEQVAILLPDVILMDLQMPTMSGLEAIPVLRQQYPEIEIIALTSVADHGSITQAVQAGAIGYLLKDTQSDQLLRAIRAAYEGRVQLSLQTAVMLLQGMHLPDHSETFIDMEIHVLRLLGSGKSTLEIAQALRMDEKSVRSYVRNILYKLHLNSRTQAALYALRLGLSRLD